MTKIGISKCIQRFLPNINWYAIRYAMGVTYRYIIYINSRGGATRRAGNTHPALFFLYYIIYAINL